MNIRDTQCGAKVMRRGGVEKIHSYVRIADMAFDINLLYSLKRAGSASWRCRPNGPTRSAPKWPCSGPRW